MGTLYGWWRMHQEVRQVSREEGIAFADYAVDTLFDGRCGLGRYSVTPPVTHLIKRGEPLCIGVIRHSINA